MAPEQCLAAPAVDGKADVYALGIILYQMLAGRLPFDAQHSFDFMAAHVRQEPRPLGGVVPGIAEEIADLVHGMLAKEPAERPSMEVVVTLLDQVHAALPLISAPPGALPAGARQKNELSALAATASGPSGQSARISKELIELGATAPGLVPASSRSGRDSQPAVTPRMERPNPQAVMTPSALSTPPAVSPALSQGAGSERPRRRRGLRIGLVLLLVAVAGTLRLTVLRPRAAVPVHAKVTSEAPRMVKWEVDSIPSGAQVVREDGRVLGATPWQIERPAGPGETTLILRYAGYKDQPLVLSYNTEVKTEVRLQSLPPPAPTLPATPTPSSSEPGSDTSTKREGTKRGRKLRKGSADQKDKRSPDTDVKLLFD